MCKMEHKDVTNDPPPLKQVLQYADWKEKFEVFIQSEDSRMWSYMIDGYIAPTRHVDERAIVISNEKMTDSEKRMYDVEKKALAAKKMSLPFEIKHICNRFRSSREL
ncbi:hypothetical protein HanRHA438_Chr08g0365841 [Helianthus annuus]|nr:hypothetical protein HanXRQr2_Chr08g0353761 [Helianthus annuus]KAJ0548247.1 hypothetical protein HanIR_Chr08g0381511 [Helianthus annuus]KAJ0723431.1 hypothetical protein HanOQP8_Chr08g0298171 [Helianthus annuus]KAJ0899213.1 hypothetical protein HanRHA438_Chr08g0365841 [Helianthus annuus]